MSNRLLLDTGFSHVQPVAAGGSQIHNRTVHVDGLGIFHRETGPRNAPAVLCCKVLTSSRMFPSLIPLLGWRIASGCAGLSGFGGSARPDGTGFIYTFENVARVITKFTRAIGLSR
jgi:hypothetical protein